MFVKTITVTELKTYWAWVEAQVEAGETFEVLDRGRVAAPIVPPPPRDVLEWPDHLATALKNDTTKVSDIVAAERAGWP